MMPQKPSIKIIKRDERERASQPDIPPPVKEEDEPRDFSREVSSTVAGWIREFQEGRERRTIAL